MRRALLGLALISVACGPQVEEAHYVRVVVATNLAVPDDINGFSVRVTKDDAVKFEQNYAEAALLTLPDSVILEEDNAVFVSPDNEITLPIVRVQVTGYKDSTPVVWQSLAFNYGSGKVQVPMPLCSDCLAKECPEDRCVRGMCESDFVKKASLPRDDDGVVDPLSSCGPP